MYGLTVNSTPLPVVYVLKCDPHASPYRFTWLSCGVKSAVLPWMVGSSFIGAPHSLSYPCLEVYSGKINDQIWTRFVWRFAWFLQIFLCTLFVLLTMCFGDYHLLVLISELFMKKSQFYCIISWCHDKPCGSSFGYNRKNGGQRGSGLT